MYGVRQKVLKKPHLITFRVSIPTRSNIEKNTNKGQNMTDTIEEAILNLVVSPVDPSVYSQDGKKVVRMTIRLTPQLLNIMNKYMKERGVKNYSKLIRAAISHSY